MNIIKKLMFRDKEGYKLPDRRRYVGDTNDSIVDKINELVDAHNELVYLERIKPKTLK